MNAATQDEDLQTARWVQNNAHSTYLRRGIKSPGDEPNWGALLAVGFCGVFWFGLLNMLMFVRG